jgi:hypothetical protein
VPSTIERLTKIARVGLYATAIGHCQAFVIQCAQLACNPTYEHYRWSWPGNHQPLHAITVLIMDILSNSQPAVNATCLRTREILNVVFALCAPNSGIVSGGPELADSKPRLLVQGGARTWVLVKRLRDQAWQKAGWDIDVSCTREDAITYCQRHAQSDFHAGDAATQTDSTASGTAHPMTESSDTASALLPDQLEDAALHNIDWYVSTN